MQLVTLDTMYPRDLWEDRAERPLVERLLDLARDGTVDIAVTRYIADDVRYNPLAQRIGELRVLGVVDIGGVFVLNRSKLGDPQDVLAKQCLEDLRARLRVEGRVPPAIPGDTDWLHLHAHHVRSRNVFLTRDKAILNLCDELRACEVVVMRLADYLDQIPSES